MKYLLVILFSLYVLGGRAENRASFPGDKVVTIDELFGRIPRRMSVSLTFTYRMEGIIWRFRMICCGGIF